MTKKKIEEWTLLVLAIGVLGGVSLNVVKWIVRDYHDLQNEIHQPVKTQAHNDGSAE